MKSRKIICLSTIMTLAIISNTCFCQSPEVVWPRHKVTLNEAHIGSFEIDTMLLNSYDTVPSNLKQFYLEARGLFEKDNIDFTYIKILQSASNNEVLLMGGPMLGNVKDNSISIWFRPSNKSPIHVKLSALNSDEDRVHILEPIEAGKEQLLVINNLLPSTTYNYAVISQNVEIADGTFKTAPKHDGKDEFRLAFGSCFHKIGLHNPNLIGAILKREPHAMMILGDIAVDDRENNFNLHRSDYLLRDVSKSWKKLAANVPLYTSWDDHDYLNNDLGGIPPGFTEKDREELRAIWHQNWNNPPNNEDGIYFNTRIGQVEIIMLDTRSFRIVEERGGYNSYLGAEQMAWLVGVLENSTATFKVISSGTMWSDYITNGKDSWGTWDTLAREEIYNLIETNNITGVLLVSGDRHGARGFTIPRKSGFKLYEFEVATLGGVPGPIAIAEDSSNQLFGYEGKGLMAFGEFTFEMDEDEARVTFRLIDEFGNIMEAHLLPYDVLTPKKGQVPD